MKLNQKLMGFAGFGAAAAVLTIQNVHARPMAVMTDDPAPVTVQRNLSVRFSNANVQEVLDWLSKQDVDFVVSNKGVDTSTRITLNASDRPLAEIEDALAESLGGHWSHTGKMLVFHKSDGAFGINFLSGAPGAKAWTVTPSAPKNFTLLHQMPQSSLKKPMTFFAPKAWSNMSAPGAPGAFKNFGKTFTFTAPAMPKDWAKGLRVTPFMGTLQADKLIGSLTAAQKATYRSRGYLTPQDLSPTQMAYLGNMHGTFEIDIKTDNGSIKIKSK